MIWGRPGGKLENHFFPGWLLRAGYAFHPIIPFHWQMFARSTEFAKFFLNFFGGVFPWGRASPTLLIVISLVVLFLHKIHDEFWIV